MSVTNSSTIVDSRETRGMRIAAAVKLRKNGAGWLVPSQSGNGDYLVDPDKGTCTCPDHAVRGMHCKHLWAVEFTVTRETGKDGSIKETRTMRVSHEWSTYNAAQENEERLFHKLLGSLCDGIPQPPQTFGRPRLPLSDVVVALALKVYSTLCAASKPTLLQVSKSHLRIRLMLRTCLRL